MRHEVVGGIYWKGEWCEAGTILDVDPDDPADAGLLEYYAPFGALRLVGESSPPEGGGEGGDGPIESDAASASGPTPPITTTEGPTHVGRRHRT